MRFVRKPPQHLGQRAVDIEPAIAALEDDGPYLRRRRADLQQLEQAQLLKVRHLRNEMENGVWFQAGFTRHFAILDSNFCDSHGS
jgi:hypothetical protein